MAEKKSKKADKDLKAKIKEMENSKRDACAVPLKTDKRVSFSSWYHQRSSKIPKQHMKEILWADFKSRGLKKEETMEAYDKALKLYGIKL